MLRIHPISSDVADSKISEIYIDINNTFQIHTVPLFFQYLANYEQYLFFIWNKMKKNIISQIFFQLCSEVNAFAEQTISTMPLSESLLQFAKALHEEERQQIVQTVTTLEQINTQLFLLTLDLRESMKSISIGTIKLPQYSSGYSQDNTKIPFSEMYQQESSKMTKASQLLAPLFGNNALVTSHYSDFFALVADEINRLKQEENYLQKRVELEHLGLISITKFIEPLGFSYQEFRKLTEDKPFVDDLVYLITDAFPSQFPHLIFTTALMKSLLQRTHSIATT